ncbi:MAG: beta-N-acetylglucosaminidase domain-containing protein [Clostridia bacterium]|nr:beta-N-acetylglucosaminidase domain-containing protein [Clostridia bacterium]
MIFPKPKHLSAKGYFSFADEIRVSLSRCMGLSSAPVNTVFGETVTDGNLLLCIFREDSLGEISDEAYRTELCEKGGVLTVSLYSSSEKGLIRGLFALRRMTLKNEFPIGEITDYPSFSVRGYIEGFYGNPWKSEERPEMLRLMALFGENTHYYAPKDDPYHRNKWRELYPENEASQLKALVDEAKSLFVDFYYCIAPGLSMKYSDDGEFESLKAKTRQLYTLGISRFGLLLDDIPSDLFYEEDKIKYGNAVNAHVELVKKYRDFLKTLSPDVKLTVCPTSYRGKGTEPELVEFASAIPPDIDVFFTGSDICSKEITLSEAEIFNKNNFRKPLYWDNYPVNDAEMFMEMHLGPVIGRDPELFKGSAGLISNCMEYFGCNKFPLITIAAYLWNSEDYDPEESFLEAVNFLLPEEEREAFILLSDHCRTACLHDENSKIMGEYLSRASVEFQTGNRDLAVNTVSVYTERVEKAYEIFRQYSEKPLYKELSRWIKKFGLMCEIMKLSLKYLEGAKVREELIEKMSDYNESATVLTSFCFREYIESVLGDD